MHFDYRLCDHLKHVTIVFLADLCCQVVQDGSLFLIKLVLVAELALSLLVSHHQNLMGFLSFTKTTPRYAHLQHFDFIKCFLILLSECLDELFLKVCISLLNRLFIDRFHSIDLDEF